MSRKGHSSDFQMGRDFCESSLSFLWQRSTHCRCCSFMELAEEQRTADWAEKLRET